jgi:hypothetical protein
VGTWHVRAVLLASAACSALLGNACGFDGTGTRAVADAGGGGGGGEGGTTSAADASTNGDANFDIGTSRSCKEILALNPSSRGKSGAYTLELYCDMVIDGGGWTLVGRTAPSGKPPFGWKSRAGTVADLTRPYSMDVAGAGLAFSEVMIADREPTAHAYKFSVAPDFLTTYANDRLRTGTVTTLLGDCTPGATRSMFQYAGATALTDAFFLRDVDDVGQHRGLRPDAWDLAYTNCDQGGSLDGKQGFVFVR